MKVILFAAAASVFVLTGCESISDATSGMREKFAERAAPHTKSFSAAPRAVYDAARKAATGMGYRITRGGAAQGELEAISGVGPGERMGSSRQLTMKVKIDNALNGGSDVAVKITEILEADSSNRAGQATEVPLRDTPQYEVFFRRVGDELGLPDGPAKK